MDAQHSDETVLASACFFIQLRNPHPLLSGEDWVIFEALCKCLVEFTRKGADRLGGERVGPGAQRGHRALDLCSNVGTVRPRGGAVGCLERDADLVLEPTRWTLISWQLRQDRLDIGWDTLSVVPVVGAGTFSGAGHSQNHCVAPVCIRRSAKASTF